VVNFDSNLDVTELPIAIQLPDWKSWLPEVHPKDLWPDGYFESENVGQEYAKIIEVLERVDISTLIQSGDIVSLLDAFQGAVKKWIAEGREDDDGGRGDKWRVYRGTEINNRESRFSREYTKVNLAKWMALKYFEMMHEYRLEYQADLLVGKVDPIEGTRQWPNSDRTLFEIAPHFTSDDWSNFQWQSELDGKYMSSAWYQLQMIVNPGEFNQGGNGGPLDWSYHFNHIYDMTDLGAPREGFRYFSSFLKLLQTRSNDFGLQHSGWRMRYIHPWWAFSDQYGDESSMNDPQCQ